MGGKKADKSYRLASEEDHAASRKDSPEPSRKKEPLPLEPTEPDPEPTTEESPSIRALDVCPNCSAPLGGVDAVVCLRCGFDLKTLKVIKTATGGAAAKEEAEEEEEAEPLSAPGKGGLWLPGAIVIASLGFMAVGYFRGWSGLFGAEAAAGFTDRLVGLVQMSVRTLVWTFAGTGGLLVLAHMLATRVGDLKLAAVRVLAIVAAISLFTILSFESKPLEWTVQLALQAAAFLGLAMALFGLSARDATTLLGVTVISVVMLLLISALVLWAAPPI